jgi:hypothetical protein
VKQKQNHTQNKIIHSKNQKNKRRTVKKKEITRKITFKRKNTQQKKEK